MNQSKYYALDHCISKTIVCVIYIVIGATSIHFDNAYIALIPGTVVWFFGVNTVGHLLETLWRHEHSHRWV